MSVYQEKILELIAIDKKNDQFFLKLKLIFKQEIEFYWEIDEQLANQLLEIADFEKEHKYRLSFYTFWNPSQKQHRSYITKTHLEESERIYFTCSEEYIQILNDIKLSRQISNLHTLPFLSAQLPGEQPEVEHNDDKKKVIQPTKSYRKFAWISVFIISIFFIGYFGYTNLSLDKAESVKAEAYNSKIVMAPVKAPFPKKVKEKKPAIPVVTLKKTVNYSVPKGSVALTFDDGPSKYSKKMVNILKKYQVGGTFFYIGLNVKNRPEDVKYTKNNGFTIGSHSMNHSDFSKLSYQKQEKEFTEANQLITKITGNPVILFRPPYGAKNNNTVKMVKKHKSEVVLWNIDTEDWKSRNSKKIIQSVKKEKVSGSVILFHESQATLDALPDIIEYLQKQDLKIVSLQ